MKQGRISVQNKSGNPIFIDGSEVYLEWFKITDYEALFEVDKKLATAYAEAFADEAIYFSNFLLNDELEIKEEFVQDFESLSQEEQEELNWKLSISSFDRTTRVESVKQRYLEQVEMAKSVFFSNPEVLSPINSIVIIAKNQTYDVLGFAVFTKRIDNVVNLDLLGIIPIAQACGLLRPMIFPILKLLSSTKYTGQTQLWNIRAQRAYEALNFQSIASNGWYIDYEFNFENY